MKSLLIFFLVLSAGVFSAFAPNQLFNTSLTVTVRDELGNTQDSVSVRLFLKEADFTKEENSIAEATTDKKGVCHFKKIKPESYYILARKGDKDNTGGGEKIGKLENGKFNKITIIIQ
ncbi:MAG TPA: hypothetical protein VGQ59_12455 [Cyclobacteriaceae bacterium]|jgi:uncharacterized protein (DUF2141 family)|nr:hypothetical protein [Cyclobacteriaceae bacterium]